MSMKKAGRILCAVVCLVLLVCLMPLRAEATVDPPSHMETNEYWIFYGNGTPLYVDGTADGKTVIYYYSGDTKTYINPSKEAGDDLSNCSIYGGYNNANRTASGTSVTVYGGSVGSITGGSVVEKAVPSTKVAIHGGQVKNVTLGGNGDVTSSATLIITGGRITGNISLTGKDGTTKTNGIKVFISGGDFTRAYISGAYSGAIKGTDGNWRVNGSGQVPEGCTMTVDAGKTANIGSVTDTANNLSVYGSLVVNGTVYNYGADLDADDVASGTGKVLNLSHVTASVSGNEITFTAESGYLLPQQDTVSVTDMDGNAVSGWTLSGNKLTLPSTVTGAIVTASPGTPAASLTVNGVTTTHATLQDAYDASQGSGVITVLKDISGVEYGIHISNHADKVDLVVDLNGYTVDASKCGIRVCSYDKLTIRSSRSGGKLVGATEYGIMGYGEYTIESGEIVGEFCGVDGISVTISGGTITSTRTGSGRAVAATVSVKMEGGTLSGHTGIFANNDAKVTISNGTINGAAAGVVVEDRNGGGTLTISGGTINAPTDINLSNASGYTVSVSGGTYTDGLAVSGDGRTVQSVLAQGKACYAGDTIVNLAANATTTGTDTVVVKTADLKDAIVEVDLPAGGYTYSGAENKPAVVSVTLGGVSLTADQYEVSYQNNTDAGEASVVLTAKAPYTGTKTVTFRIEPYAVKSADLEFADTTITKEYDATTASAASVQIKANTFGNAEAIAVAGSAVYNSKDVANANTVTFTPDAVTTGNYTLTADQTLSAAATITPKTISVSGIQVADKVYDGTTAAQISNSGELTGVQTGDTVTVDLSNLTAAFADKNAGEDKAVTLSSVTLGGADAGNYTLSAQSTVAADITPRELAVTNVVTSEQHLDFLMLGAMINPSLNPYVNVTTGTLANAVAGDDVALGCTTWYQKLLAGDAVPVICKFTLTGADKGNYVIGSIGGTAVTETDGVYEYASTAKVTCTYQPTKGVEYVVNTNDWTNESFAVSPSSSAYLVVPGDFPFDQIDASKPQELVQILNAFDPSGFKITEETDADGETVAFYIIDGFNLASGRAPVSVQVTETYKIDKTLPEGVIKMEERQWNTWLGSVVFDYFTSKDVTVTITASDTLSGVAKVEYLESAAAMTLEELNQSNKWKTGTNVNVTAEDAKQFVYYARITDNAGNVTVIGSDGTVFDTVLPVISGVENGKTYYTTQTVAVTEVNLDSVKVNGQIVDGPVTLAGNVDAEYTIIVKDKAGNETQVVVTMKPLDSLAPETAQTSVDAVLLPQEQTIEEELAALNVLDISKATDAEKEALEELKQQAEDLLERIEAVIDALSTDALPEAQEITKDNVTLGDEEVLTQAKEDLEGALERYAGNLTDMEQEVQEVQQQIVGALDAIGNAKAVQALINALPETAQPDDEKALTGAKEASDAYGALTQQEKTMVETKKLDDLLAVLRQYKIVKNDNAILTGTCNLEITANGPFSKFTGIKVDGNALKAEDYTAVAGSTIVTLKKEFLDTLTNGKHSVTICFNDGEAVGSFTVELPGNATTGDTSNPTLLIVLVVVSAVGIVVVILLLLPKKRGKYEKSEK